MSKPVEVNAHNIVVATGVYLCGLVSLAVKAAVVVAVVRCLW